MPLFATYHEQKAAEKAERAQITLRHMQPLIDVLSTKTDAYSCQSLTDIVNGNGLYVKDMIKCCDIYADDRIQHIIGKTRNDHYNDCWHMFERVGDDIKAMLYSDLPG